MVLKRVFDLLMAVAAMLVLSPVILLVAVLIRWSLGPPVLFRQERPGLHGRLFRLYKFRTMRQGRPGEQDRDRMTRLGLWLRRASLDELPELWNVIRGDMSLVGPRPLLPEYLGRYSEFQARRHEVRPGITGWAQVNGRNELGWEERLSLDVWYVDHRSFWLDLKILLRTFGAVLSGQGVQQAGHATMAPFEGTPERLPPREAPDG